MLLILIHAGYVEEAVEWRKWLLRRWLGRRISVQTIYGIGWRGSLWSGSVPWLPGYEARGR